jgi:hypothetical protein
MSGSLRSLSKLGFEERFKAFRARLVKTTFLWFLRSSNIGSDIELFTSVLGFRSQLLVSLLIAYNSTAKFLFRRSNELLADYPLRWLLKVTFTLSVVWFIGVTMLTVPIVGSTERVAML